MIANVRERGLNGSPNEAQASQTTERERSDLFAHVEKLLLKYGR